MSRSKLLLLVVAVLLLGGVTMTSGVFNLAANFPLHVSYGHATAPRELRAGDSAGGLG